jgi:hypothetical protein
MLTQNRSDGREKRGLVLLHAERDTSLDRCDCHTQRQRNVMTSSPASSRHSRAISADQTGRGWGRWRDRCELLQDKETQHHQGGFQLQRRGHRECLCSLNLQDRTEEGSRSRRKHQILTAAKNGSRSLQSQGLTKTSRGKGKFYSGEWT